MKFFIIKEPLIFSNNNCQFLGFSLNLRSLNFKFLLEFAFPQLLASYGVFYEQAQILLIFQLYSFLIYIPTSYGDNQEWLNIG